MPVFIGGWPTSAPPTPVAVAALGTVLCLIQLLVYAVLARQHNKAVYLVWAALAVVLALAPRADSRRTC